MTITKRISSEAARGTPVMHPGRSRPDPSPMKSSAGLAGENWSSVDEFNVARLLFCERERGMPSLNRGWRTAELSPSRDAAVFPAPPQFNESGEGSRQENIMHCPPGIFTSAGQDDEDGLTEKESVHSVPRKASWSSMPSTATDLGGRYQDMVDFLNSSDLMPPKGSTGPQVVKGVVGPSASMRQQYDDVHAVQHATNPNFWIFAVQHEAYTKMIGVTLCGTEEVAPRQARHKMRSGSMDQLAISEAWDTGNMYGYVGSPSDRGYYLAKIDIQMPGIAEETAVDLPDNSPSKADKNMPVRIDLSASARLGLESKAQENDAKSRTQTSISSENAGCDSWSSLDRFSISRLEFAEQKRGRGMFSLGRGWCTADPSPSRSAADLPGCGPSSPRLHCGSEASWRDVGARGASEASWHEDDLQVPPGLFPAIGQDMDGIQPERDARPQRRRKVSWSSLPSTAWEGIGGRYQDMVDFLNCDDLMAPKASTTKPVVKGVVGPSASMKQQYDDVHAVQHATTQNLWIFAVQHEVYTKMIGVTLCGAEEVGPRQARYKIRNGSMDRQAISEAWDTGNMYGYVGTPSDRGYYLASIDIQGIAEETVGEKQLEVESEEEDGSTTSGPGSSDVSSDPSGDSHKPNDTCDIEANTLVPTEHEAMQGMAWMGFPCTPMQDVGSMWYPVPAYSPQYQQMLMGGMLMGAAAQDSGLRLNSDAAAFVPADAQDQEKVVDIRAKETKEPVEVPRTTVMLRNLPDGFSRAMMLDLLQKKGFGGDITFLYMPVDFRKKTVLGYAFVDLVSTEIIPVFWKAFDGFADWETPSENVCAINWSEPHQGLQANIERYRNSSVMHDTVDDEFKPMLFKDGQRIPFPKPTQAIRFPRVRDRQPGRS